MQVNFMMSEEKSVLGDITNCLGKRDFSLISENVYNKEGVNDKDKGKGKRACMLPHPISGINSIKGNVISGISKIPNSIKGSNLSDHGFNLDLGNGDGKCGVNDKERGKRACISPRHCSEIDSIKGNVISDISKMHSPIKVSSLSDCDYNLGLGNGDGKFVVNDKERGRACSEINSIKGNVVSGISKMHSLIKGSNLSDCDYNPGLGNGDAKCVVNDKERGKQACISPSEIDSIKGNDISGKSKIHSLIKESSLLCRGFNLDLGNGDASRVSCASPCSKGCIGDEGEDNKDEQLVTDVCENDGNDVSVDNLELGKCGSLEWSRFPESQESRTSGLERGVGLKGDGCSNPNAGVDLIKVCCCSFCTKAAYIWSDLHYQDIKGRIAALKKSKKEASILVERSCRNKGTEKHGQGNSNKFLKLESDLMAQWRSLFLHMEDIFGRESSQLEASLFTLKDLRENCKTELESINCMPSEKQ